MTAADTMTKMREEVFDAIRAFTAATVAEAEQATSAILRIAHNASPYRLSAQQREPVVRVKELTWSKEPPYHVARMLIGFYSVEYIESDDGGYFDLRGSFGRTSYRTLAEAKSAAQDDYEQRIMAAIEIAPQSDRQPLPGQKQISETGKELPENAEQPMNNADVSVGELAGFFVTEFPHLLTMSTQIEVARALLARYRIGRK